jgi:predicted DNA-binding transcriptional regulator AlpA
MAKRKHFDYCRAMTRSAGFKIIRKHELAKMLDVSTSTIYRMIASGSLPPPLRTEKGYIQGWLLEHLQAWKK